MRLVRVALLALALALLAGLPFSSASGDVSEPNGPEDFAVLARKGFSEVIDGAYPGLVANPDGSKLNSYVWGMEYFNGKLLAGTVRDLFCMIGGGDAYDCPEPPPDALPTPGLEQRAEMWSYTPAGAGGIEGSWVRTLQSPTLRNSPPFDTMPDLFITLIEQISGLDFDTTAKDVGYRNMETCDAGGGPPRLYVATMGVGGRILYSNDGQSFQQASTAGAFRAFTGQAMASGEFDLGYRPLLCWKGRLWTSPVGSVTDPDISDNPVVLVNSAPANSASPWELVVDVKNDPTYGDSGNLSIFTMQTAFDGPDADSEGDFLYLGTLNRTTGAEIWKTAGCPNPAPNPCGTVTWTKVFDNGGGRPLDSGSGQPNSAGVAQMAEFGGQLYAGVSESAVYRATQAELIRIQPDDTWDLVMGEPRVGTPAGLNCNAGTYDPLGSAPPTPACVPLSDMGPGFGGGPSGYAGGRANYVWTLTPHTTATTGLCLYAGTLDLNYTGSTVNVWGFDLLRSCDGLNWDWIDDAGFGNGANYGIRNMISTPIGLAIGTANPFSQEATGGSEVWLQPNDCAAPDGARLPQPYAGPDQTLFDNESYPAAGDGMVNVTADGSRSVDPFCGSLTAGGGHAAYEWYLGSFAGDDCTNLNPADAIGVNAILSDYPLSTGPDYTDYTLTLRVQDDEGNAACDTALVRASHNLYPSAALTWWPTSPTQSGGSRVLLYDVDGDGKALAAVEGICSDPEGLTPLACDWQPETDVTISDPDADPGTVNAVAFLLGNNFSSDTIRLWATDDHGYTGSASRNFRVVAPPADDPAVNDAPVCEGASMIASPGSANVPVPLRCFDPDDTSLTYEVIDPPSNGSIAGSLTYTPNAEFSGADFFTYRACDDDPTPKCSAAVPVFVAVSGLVGDCNASGSVTILDAQLVAQYVVGLIGACTGNGDANASGSVTILDAQLIAQYVVGLIPTLPPQ